MCSFHSMFQGFIISDFGFSLGTVTLSEAARACPGLPEAREGSGKLGRPDQACPSLPEPWAGSGKLGQPRASSDRVTVPKLGLPSHCEPKI